MTQFEFMFSGVAIVLGIAVARLLEGLYEVQSSRPWSGIVTYWLIAKLANVILYFWVSWDARDASNWGLVDFATVLIAPAIVFLQAHCMVTGQPGKIDNWVEHFQKIRVRFFALNTLFGATLLYQFCRESAVANEELGLVFRSIVVAYSIVGMISPSLIVQRAVIAVAIVIQGLAFVGIMNAA